MEPIILFPKGQIKDFDRKQLFGIPKTLVCPVESRDQANALIEDVLGTE